MNEKAVKNLVNSASALSVNDLLSPSVRSTFGDLMDESRSRLAEQSEAYQEDDAAVNRAEDAYMELDLTEEQRMVVDEYKTAIERFGQTAADISYIAGFEDCVRMMKMLGLVKAE
ncbi:MAG: hypothetical protein LUG99_09270 [Lachnospiraceae bacterium]|nr:hypothetical protein [Lachnospiraceae bacterium]